VLEQNPGAQWQELLHQTKLEPDKADDAFAEPSNELTELRL